MRSNGHTFAHIFETIALRSRCLFSGRGHIISTTWTDFGFGFGFVAADRNGTKFSQHRYLWRHGKIRRTKPKVFVCVWVKYERERANYKWAESFFLFRWKQCSQNQMQKEKRSRARKTWCSIESNNAVDTTSPNLMQWHNSHKHKSISIYISIYQYNNISISSAYWIIGATITDTFINTIRWLFALFFCWSCVCVSFSLELCSIELFLLFFFCVPLLVCSFRFVSFWFVFPFCFASFSISKQNH